MIVRFLGGLLAGRALKATDAPWAGGWLTAGDGRRSGGGPLASSVWTTNHARILRTTSALDFGCVWINTHGPLTPEMPHGGFKHSGHGKDLSSCSLADYTRVKHVMSAISDLV